MSAQPSATGFLIPEGAPFNEDQRAWLSGFFSALVAGSPNTPVDMASAPAAESNTADAPVLASNDAAPWHDPAMAIEDRMALAETAPLASKLMAAMAQQDCGQCGYNCADYANAIFLRKEERLNLCAPGGKDTARMVKKLSEALLDAPLSQTLPASVAEAAASIPSTVKGCARDNPALVTFLNRQRLTGKGSQKDTWHIDFHIGDLDYRVGDSFGVFVKNDVGLVDQIIALMGFSPITRVHDKHGLERPLRDVLCTQCDLGAAPDSLFELFTFVSGGALRAKARALAQGDDPDGDAKQLDVMAACQKFSMLRMHAEAFVEALQPLQPRLYSISSSPRFKPQHLSLSVDAVRYAVHKRQRLGVASTYLADRATPGDILNAYVQRAHNFALPANPQTPIIMVGPGTGIAPFRAFLQERACLHNDGQAIGRNWLFFGHQHQASDFFYKDELTSWRKNGVLTRLSLAWSRDGDEKFYVQDRMREVGSELWQWLADGAHFYICGDAKRMAKDVETALIEIVARHGARTTDEAIAYVQALKKSQRYQADVY